MALEEKDFVLDPVVALVEYFPKPVLSLDHIFDIQDLYISDNGSRLLYLSNSGGLGIDYPHILPCEPIIVSYRHNVALQDNVHLYFHTWMNDAKEEDVVAYV